MLNLAADMSERKRGANLLGGMNPEFLREGSAVDDFFEPSLIVIGADDDASAGVMKQIYANIEARIEVVPTRTAELVKYANNAFHATKIVFANEIDRLSRACGVDGTKVMELLCLDSKLNISTKYLRPGFAYGGSCLPKDLRGLNHLAHRSSVRLPMMGAVISSNDVHIDDAAERILSRGGRNVGVLGVTFKAGTDDVRESPALALVRRLTDAGLDVRMFDVNLDHELLGANRRHLEGMVPDWPDRFLHSSEELIEFADTVVITTSEDVYYNALERAESGKEVIDLTLGSGPTPARDSRDEIKLDVTA
jgi:GDP-mannose 6-dehydrogenase